MKWVVLFVIGNLFGVAFGTTCDTTQEPGFQCYKCNMASFCEDLESSYDVTCDATTLEVCWTEKEGVPCESPEGKTIDSCGCLDPSGETNLTGTFRDPYNPSAYFTCSMGSPSFYECPATQIYALTSNDCIDEPSCSENSNGYYPVIGDCNAYLICEADPISGTSSSLGYCDYQQIFDFPSQGCSLEFSCDGRLGEFADPYKSDLFYSCFNASEIDNTAHCCKPGQVYSSSSKQCVEKVEGGSASIFNSCLEELYENNYCGTCEGEVEGHRYETWELCSRNYWECQEVDGKMQSVLVQCPEGNFYDKNGSNCVDVCPSQ